MKVNINKIGDQIKKFRELRSYTQDHVAEQLEMTAQGYGRIERNEVEISLQKLQRIAEIIGTTIQDILGFEDKFVFNNHECLQHNLGLNQSPQLSEFQKQHEIHIQTMQKEIDWLRSQLEKRI